MIREYTGEKHGNWLVVGEGFFDSKASSRIVDAICSCGNEVAVNYNSIKKGISSGCMKCRKHKIGHGMSKTRTYYTWNGMNDRCSRSAHEMYRYYGGRGITVCDRWRGIGGFDNFLEDMGVKPEGLQIDRINNDGNYEPGNCRWATAQENARNKIHWTIGVKKGDHPNCKKIVSIDSAGNISKYKSLAIAVEETGVNISSLIMVLSGKRKTAKGFRWEFEV